jgi:hypothetical protein
MRRGIPNSALSAHFCGLFALSRMIASANICELMDEKKNNGSSNAI